MKISKQKGFLALEASELNKSTSCLLSILSKSGRQKMREMREVAADGLTESISELRKALKGKELVI